MQPSTIVDPLAPVAENVIYTDFADIVDLPFYPLNAPGMPPVGKSFLQVALDLGDTLDKEKVEKKTVLVHHGQNLTDLYKKALYRSHFQLPVLVKGRRVNAPFLPGHLWGSDEITGPVAADVMVIGKWPSQHEMSEGRNFAGPSGEELIRGLEECGVDKASYDLFYVTNVVRHPSLDPSTQRAPQDWVKNCMPLLAQELRLVKPKFILCLGAEATAAVLGKDCGGVSGTKGRPTELVIPLHRREGDTPEYHTAQVMTCIHPAAVARAPDNYPDFVASLKKFVELVGGGGVAKPAEVVDHRVVDKARDLKEIVDDILADPNGNCIAVDCEWNGDYPGEANAYLRTLQFTHKAGFAVCVKLRAQGGALAFVPSIDSAVAELRRLFSRPDLRLIGHHFRADLPWIKLGLDNELGEMALKAFDAPAEDSTDPKGLGRLAWDRTVDEGGFDTMLAAHAVTEAAGGQGYKLEILGSTQVGVPRYDRELIKWKTEYCRKNQLKAEELDGYGMCPEEILHPYSLYDVDVTWRLFDKYNKPGGLLDSDAYGNNARKAFWISMRATLGCLDMEMVGLVIDKDRGNELTQDYMAAYADLKVEMQSRVKWPGFNANSAYHARTFLFGPEYSGKRDKDDGHMIDISPKGSVSLHLTPVKSTGKPSQPWERVVWKKQEAVYTPAADRETLGILAARTQGKPGHSEICLLRDLKLCGRVLSSVLAPPPEVATEAEESESEVEYEKGLLSWCHADGRIRTHIFQTKETGRFSSARPPLHNISKKREHEYERILGKKYKHPLRSLIASPPGYAFVEADYIGAELFMMAAQSRSAKMVDHCQRASLKEAHPNYYNIHSNSAVGAFKLTVDTKELAEKLKVPLGSPLPATKSALALSGNKHLYDVAKCVVAGTRLATTQGQIRVEDLCGHLADDEAEEYTGDIAVFSDVGVTPIVGLYNGGVKPCIRVTSVDGHELTTTEEHGYRVIDQDGDYVWRKAKDVRPGDWVVVLDTPIERSGGDVTFPQLEIVGAGRRFEPLDFPKKFNEDWAAFLGLCVAECSAEPESGSVQLCQTVDHSPGFEQKLCDLYRRLFGDRAKITSVNEDHETNQRQIKLDVSSIHLARWLHLHGMGQLQPQRRLPDFVFKWTPKLQRVFLRWLFEGDGSVKANGKGFSITYSSSSARLAKEVQLLLGGLGIYARRSTETREGYDGVYQVLQLKYESARMRFMAQIGFVTDRKNDRANSKVAHLLDWSEVPNQQEHLKRVRPYLHGKSRDKCTECLRKISPVRLNQTRLEMFAEALATSIIVDTEASNSAKHLIALAKFPVRFVPVQAVEAVGDLQTYDVQTIDPHSVCYGGLITHQTICFGLPYGRGDDAIVRAIEEEGVFLSTEEVSKVRERILGEYPELEPFLEDCAKRVMDPGWMRNCFGRYRRFQRTTDESVLSGLERQAKNFDIQSGVADAVSRALDFLHNDPHNHERFHIVLQLHDALMFYVKVEWLEWFLDEEKGLLKTSMTDRVDVKVCDLDGEVVPGTPIYHMGIETAVMLNWGEKIDREEGILRGIPERYLPKPK